MTTPTTPLRHSADEYVRADPYAYTDRDVLIRARIVKVVRTRKPQVCVPPTTGSPHEIPAGTIALYEHCFVEGVPARCYVCSACMDDYIDGLRPQ